MGYVDLHSHILPGLDDGAPDADVSLRIMKSLAAAGFDTICATPHQKTGQFLPELSACRSEFSATQERATGAGLQLTLHLGAENMWDATLYERMLEGKIPCYGDSSVFLFELPTTHLPPGLIRRLFELRTRGHLPVLAHPERYQPLWGNVDLAEELHAQCAFVLDLGAIAGYHGRKPKKVARKMLEADLVDAVASDAHSADDVRGAVEGIAWIRKRLGADRVERLLGDGPRQILAGEHPSQ